MRSCANPHYNMLRSYILTVRKCGTYLINSVQRVQIIVDCFDQRLGWFEVNLFFTGLEEFITQHAQVRADEARTVQNSGDWLSELVTRHVNE